MPPFRPFNERFWEKVDKRGPDECWEWTACRNGKGYGSIGTPGGLRMVLAHRASYQMSTGEDISELQIDHRCHNRSCVNPNHLRAVTPGQNNQNMRGANRSNPTGLRGVSWCHRRKKWIARVCHQGVEYLVGSFDDPREAGEAARQKRLQLYTHNDRDRRD